LLIDRSVVSWQRIVTERGSTRNIVFDLPENRVECYHEGRLFLYGKCIPPLLLSVPSSEEKRKERIALLVVVESPRRGVDLLPGSKVRWPRFGRAGDGRFVKFGVIVENCTASDRAS
jgi:hypothetical protein